MTLDAQIRVRLDGFALDAAITAAPGSVTAVLGPNGAGKTTILRALAGSLAIDGGVIELDGLVLDDPARQRFVSPEDRRIGYVHQDLLLFPHLNVRENVAFGPRSRGTPRADARRRAEGWLERIGLADLADARPSTLSGGQAQRVALARALVNDPAVLLLDEPLASLDVTTRTATRRELRHHLDDFTGPTVLVTHDPVDALTLADRVVVLEAGQVTQAGPIAEVTARPRTRYVAELLGTNLLTGTAAGRHIAVKSLEVEVAETIEGAAFAIIAPRAVTVGLSRPEGSARNVWPATVTDIDLQGDRVRVTTLVVSEVELVAEVTPVAVATLGLVAGSPVWVSVKATEVQAYLR